jgi:hypothetical protein
MKSQRASKLKPSFVRTFTAAAAAATSFGAIAAGCGGTIVETECPATAPQYGSACSLRAVKSCTYPGPLACGAAPAFSCADGKWQSTASSCNPPALSCPTEAPIDGSACVYGLGQCRYTGTCGVDSAFTCGSSGKWVEVANPNKALARCPVAKPTNGAACTSDCARLSGNGPSCRYDQNVCGYSSFADCISGKWRVSSLSCNPPPPSYDGGGVDSGPGAAVDAGPLPVDDAGRAP